MSGRTVLVGALAMICGIAAALGMTQFLAEPSEQEAPALEMTMLPVAVVEIGRGETIAETMIMQREWPKDLVPEGAILTNDALIGKIVQSTVYPTEPFIEAKVGNSKRFSGLVPEGMRAYTILTPNDASLVAGLIVAGDKVDVLFTDRQTNKDFTGGASTTPLLQNIQVMAVGRDLGENDARTKKDTKNMRSVTLAVTLDIAIKLALASEVGTLHLALRSEQDQSTAVVNAITLNELMNTMYPALNEKQESGDFSETAQQVQLASAEEELKPITRKEIVVRTLRGFVPSSLVMAVSADGRERLNDVAIQE